MLVAGARESSQRFGREFRFAPLFFGNGERAPLANRLTRKRFEPFLEREEDFVLALLARESKKPGKSLRFENG